MARTFEPLRARAARGFEVRHAPIVRACSGLGVTVIDHDYSPEPREQRNGYVFHRCDHQASESAMARAIGLSHGNLQDFR
jgi:starch synthase